MHDMRPYPATQHAPKVIKIAAPWRAWRDPKEGAGNAGYSMVPQPVC